MRVTVNFQNGVDGSGNPVYYKEISGASSEEKPTTAIATGSSFLEVDTGDVYFYNELTGAWVKQ